MTATKKRIKLVTGGWTGQDGNSTPRHEQSLLRMSLQTPDGELGADLFSPGSRRTLRVARELAPAAACSGIRSLMWDAGVRLTSVQMGGMLGPAEFLGLLQRGPRL